MLSLRDKVLLVELLKKKKESASLASCSHRTVRHIKSWKRPMILTTLMAMIKYLRKRAHSKLIQEVRDYKPLIQLGTRWNTVPTYRIKSTSSVHGESNAHAISRRIRISYRSVWRSLVIIFKRYSYKIEHMHVLKPTLQYIKILKLNFRANGSWCRLGFNMCSRQTRHAFH